MFPNAEWEPLAKVSSIILTLAAEFFASTKEDEIIESHGKKKQDFRSGSVHVPQVRFTQQEVIYLSPLTPQNSDPIIAKLMSGTNLAQRGGQAQGNVLSLEELEAKMRGTSISDDKKNAEHSFNVR
jgi:hypothetical protein